jgi:hypothetical protein
MIYLSYTLTEEITDLYQNAKSFWLELNYIVIEQENYCFNIQIQDISALNFRRTSMFAIGLYFSCK